MSHGRQIMPDKEIADPQRLLQMFELVHDLRADRHVQRRNRLVEHDEPGIRRQRPGDRDPLALAAAELMREQARHLRLKPDEFQHLRYAVLEFLTRQVRVGSPTVLMMSPTRRRGLSEL
jgi:hypothetical protein